MMFILLQIKAQRKLVLKSWRKGCGCSRAPHFCELRRRQRQQEAAGWTAALSRLRARLLPAARHRDAGHLGQPSCCHAGAKAQCGRRRAGTRDRQFPERGRTWDVDLETLCPCRECFPAHPVTHVPWFETVASARQCRGMTKFEELKWGVVKGESTWRWHLKGGWLWLREEKIHLQRGQPEKKVCSLLPVDTEKTQTFCRRIPNRL